MHRCHGTQIVIRFLSFFACLAQPIWTFAQTVSLEEKVGQMMILGFPNSDYERVIEPQLKSIRPGGVILFRRNIHSFEQVKALNRRMFETFPNLFVMVDQEGGVVSRFRLSTPLPSALSLGQSSSTEFVQSFGLHLGQLLKALGFNTNLAPVVDLEDPTSKSIMGNRSFGSDPEKVAQIAIAYSRGLAEAGVLPVIKHFPGLGRTSQDSHVQLPTRTGTLAELKQNDLVPFQKFAEQNFLNAAMVGHIAVPSIDPSGRPSSLSKTILNQFSHDGNNRTQLLITDDLEMAALAPYGDIAARAVAAVSAGVDMIMVSWSQKDQIAAYRAILAAVHSGQLSRTRIDESYNRIMAAKEQLGRSSRTILPTQSSTEQLARLTRKLSREIFERQQKERIDALSDLSIEKIFIVGSEPRFERGVQKVLRGRHVRSQVIRVSAKTSLDALKRTLDKTAQLYVFNVTGEGSARLLRSLPNEIKSKVLVINGGYPGLIGDAKKYMAVISHFSNFYWSGAWIAQEIQKSQAINVSSY